MQKQYWTFHWKYNQIIEEDKYHEIVAIKPKLRSGQNTFSVPIDSFNGCFSSASTIKKSEQTNLCDF